MRQKIDDNRYDFDWLPGFREMTACQEEEAAASLKNPEEEGELSSPGGWQKEEATYLSERRQKEEAVYPSERRQKAEAVYPPEEPEKGEPVLPPEELQREEQINWKDYEYLLRLLPAAAREIWAAADAFLDQLEYEGSSMYAEYPDKNTVLKLADLVYEKMQYYERQQRERKIDGTEGKNCYYVPEEEQGVHTPFKHLILVMVCWNMNYRRQRYRRRKKIFPLS